MGHGEQIVLADAHFPSHSTGRPVLRADGIAIPILLDAILQLLPLDTYADAPVLMMAPVSGDTPDPEVRTSYETLIGKHETNFTLEIQELERFAFYDQAARAHAVVATGDTRKYANLILTKGVTPVA